MNNNDIVVRAATKGDNAGWKKLYYGYAAFYKVAMDEKILRTLWDWINDPDHEINCLLAFVGDSNEPCGLAHVRRMPSPLRGAEVGFLDDLFVDPGARGHKVGKALFAALEEHGREKGWPLIRWITADDNYRARGLYDQLSKKTMWNTYQMDIT